jgi:hypothetical protein
MKGRGEKAVYFAAAAAMLFILLGSGWAGNKFLFGADTFSLHLPFFLFAKKIWMTYHELPLWMPGIFMGMPAIDSTNLIYFYPTNLLFILLPLPAEQLYAVDQMIHMAAAALGIKWRRRPRFSALFFTCCRALSCLSPITGTGPT